MASESTTYAVIAGGEIRKLPCNRCGRETRHAVLTGVREDYQWADDHNSMEGRTDSFFVQCQGCETVSMLRERSNTEDFDYQTGDYLVSTEYYPPRDAYKARFEAFRLPIGLQSIYVETLKAINEGQPILAAIGVRAMVEAICADLAVSGRTLELRIDALKDRALVTAEGARCLHMLRTAGNSAAHEVKRHTSGQLTVAMGVVENIIEATYHLPDAVNQAFIEQPAKRARLAAALAAPAPLPAPPAPAIGGPPAAPPAPAASKPEP
jgi:hypothetical protein